MSEMQKTSKTLVATVFATILVVAASTAATRPAIADETGSGLWSKVLETMSLKATPADPPPEFVERTRPDPSRLRYMQPVLPHKVSPVPVKSASEVEAAKGALDAAKGRQLNPAAPTPLAAGKPVVVAKKKPSPVPAADPAAVPPSASAPYANLPATADD